MPLPQPKTGAACNECTEELRSIPAIPLQMQPIPLPKSAGVDPWKPKNARFGYVGNHLQNSCLTPQVTRTRRSIMTASEWSLPLESLFIPIA